jgi:hypothetical protein
MGSISATAGQQILQDLCPHGRSMVHGEYAISSMDRR